MSNETLEFLKWFIGVPSAVVATITIPFLIRKYYLECKKLGYEIRQLQRLMGEIESSHVKKPGAFFAWFVSYWPIPCYGSLGIFLLIGVATKSGLFTLIGIVACLIFFISGSTVQR
jgi:hypothetical protein